MVEAREANLNGILKTMALIAAATFIGAGIGLLTSPGVGYIVIGPGYFALWYIVIGLGYFALYLVTER